MKLPNSKGAFVSKEKLLNYILSEIHPVGKFKARFFRKLGFNETNIHLSEKTLIKLVQAQEVKETITSPYGTKFVIDGKINTPRGKGASIRTIWIIERGNQIPKFVTVYPL